MVVFGVITCVPHELSEGNLAVTPQIYKITGDPNHRIERLPVLTTIMLRVPVFEIGEILILDGPSGREVAGAGRKPSKWDVTCEHFDDIVSAVRRAEEVKSW